MSRQVPIGPDNMDCPKWQKPMSEVCHRCPLWTAVGEDWACGLAWTAPLLMRLSGEINDLAKEVNVLRNETKAASDRQHTMAAIAVQRARNAVVEALDPSLVPRGALPPQDLTRLLEEPKNTNGHNDD